MRHIERYSLFPELCKATSKWGLIVSWNDGSPEEEVVKAAPYLNFDEVYFWAGHAYFIFDSLQEVMGTYYITVGDDGSILNPYQGKARVYASVWGPDGECITENS